MKRKVLTFILSLVLFVSTMPILPATVEAADFPPDNTPLLYSQAMLSVDWNKIQSVGHQISGSQSCACFSLAYAKTILDNKVHYFSEYNNYGTDQYKAIANWSSGNYYATGYPQKNIALFFIYKDIQNGKPVVVQVNGRGSDQHFVTVIGFENVTSFDTLSESNFLIIDPVNFGGFKAENMGAVGYKIKYYEDGSPNHYLIARALNDAGTTTFSSCTSVSPATNSMTGSRNDGTWLFPLDKGYYNSCTDWAGCLDSKVARKCPICGSMECYWRYGTSGRGDGDLGHNGIDIGASANVLASASGKVVGVTGNSDGRGITVIIEHKITGTEYSYYSYYQHLSRSDVSVGKNVSAGDVIGFSGGTGYGSSSAYAIHLHFGIVRAKSGTCRNSGELLAVENKGWLLKYEDGEEGRICNNPAKDLPTAGGCLDSFIAHHGSVSYTFDPSKVSVGNPEDTLVTNLIKESYPSYIRVITTGQTYLKTLPCSKSTNSESADIAKLSKGKEITVCGLYLNSQGNYWYKVLSNDSDGICYPTEAYLFAGDTSLVTPLGEKGSVTGQTIPKAITKGSSFGINGTVSNQFAKLTKVGAKVTTMSGTFKTGGEANVDAYSASLSGTVDNNTIFNILDEGTYKFIIYDKQTGYYATSGSEKKQYTTDEIEVMNVTFTIKSSAVTTYTLNFDNSGKGSVNNSITVSAGTTVTLPVIENVVGYSFAGWTDTQGSSTVKYTGGSSYSVTANKTLYAVWNDVNQIIIYDKNGMPGGGMSSTVPFYYTLPGYELMSGYYFCGWATDPDSDVFEYRPGDTIYVNGIISLYPVYISHYEAISGNPVLIYNIEDVDTTGCYVTTKSVSISRKYETTEWSDWSDWNTITVEAGDTRDVETTTMYRYYYFDCPSCDLREPYSGTCDSGHHIDNASCFRFLWSTIPYSQSNSVSYDNIKRKTTSLGDGLAWYFDNSDINKTAIGSKESSGGLIITTGYRYRDLISCTSEIIEEVDAYVITASFASGSGTEVDPYIIETAEQLAYLASSTNEGTTYKGKYIKLANDIYLNDTTGWENWDENPPANIWTPIGTEDRYFSGTFDGNGYAVYGIYTDITKDDQGLFGYIYNGTIKNVGVEKSYVCGKYFVGGVCGCIFDGIIINCYNTGTVSGTSQDVGGICGRNGDTTVSNCYNAGSVGGQYVIGGICGTNGGTVTNCYNAGAVSGYSIVGGVCGFNDDVITSCYNEGTVSIDGKGISGDSERIGGVCGHNYDGTVSNSYNVGIVSGSKMVGGVCGQNFSGTIRSCYNIGTVKGDGIWVGGVCGIGTVANCYNSGAVSGYSEVGGVCGCGSAANCYNTGAVSGSSYVGGVCGYNSEIFSNCYNTGAVSGTGYCVGGVCGINYGTVTNCYYLTRCAMDGSGTVQYGIGNETLGSTTADISGRTTGLTDAQMKQQASFAGFDFDSVWTMVGNPDYLYPELVGNTHQMIEHKHSYIENAHPKYLASAATCNKKAVYYKSCEVCGEKGAETFTYGTVDKTNHIGGTYLAGQKEASCYEDGYTGDTYCSGCDAKLESGKVIGKTSHNPASVWSTDAEYHWKECQTIGCGNLIDKAPHSGGEATCISKAVCEVCHVEYGEINPSNHKNTTTINAKAATEDEEGYTGDTFCLDCNKTVQKGQPIQKLDHTHNLVATSAKESTCTATGNIAYWYCTKCQKYYSDANGINEITFEETVTEKKDHSYTVLQYDGTNHWYKCANCSATAGIEVHRGGAATCKAKAVCEICNQPYGNLGGHSYSEIVDAGCLKSSATCVSPAVYYKSCSVCGEKGEETFTYGTVDKTNHIGGTYLAGQKEASCFEEGYTGDTYCSGCNEKIASGTIITAKEHTPGEWEIETPATCTSTGTKVRKCTVCHKVTERETIPMADHELESTVVPATPDAQGYTLHQCKHCTYSYKDNFVEYVEHNPAKIVVESKRVTYGQSFTVDVAVKNNPGFAYLELTPVYSDKLTLVSVTNGELISDLTKGKQYVWVADEDVLTDGKLMTFNFSTDSDVEPGEYQVGFIVRLCVNIDEKIVDVVVENATIEIVDFTYGDANGDGVINGQDVVRIKKYLANYDYDTETSTVEINAGADANGDGVINGQDVVRLKKYLANYDYDTETSTIVLGPQN